MSAEYIEVMRGNHKDPEDLAGPFPGCRIGEVVSYEFELPAQFVPWPGQTRLERTFVLLEVGVSFSDPCWQQVQNADGTITTTDPAGPGSWYVDLITVEKSGNRYICRDLYLDVMVPTDGRPYRLLDLDEYADAMADGTLSVEVAVDGLRRWQRFLDQYLHTDRWPVSGWTDFPPAAIRPFDNIPPPFGKKNNP